MRFGIGFIAPLGRSRSLQVHVQRRGEHVAQHRDRQDRRGTTKNATTWTIHQTWCQPCEVVDVASTSVDERVADERPLLERRAGPSTAMRHASVRKPVTPMHEEHAEDQRVLGLGLDADAVRPLDVAADDRPDDADEERERRRRRRRTSSPGTTRRAGTSRSSGSWWLISSDRGDGEQDQEAEVDQRVHDAGGRVAQQRLHVDAGAEVLEAPLDVLGGGGPVVGRAPLPVLHPLGEQHRAVDDEHRDDRVEGELQRARDAAEDLALDRRVVVPLRQSGRMTRRRG